MRFSGRGREYAPGKPFTSRIAYAAAPVTADMEGENIPGAPAALDWDTTLRFRHHLWSYGFGVAEAMDTAQRGAGLDYPATRELIRRSAAEARTVGGAIVAGVGTDQLPAGPATLDEITKAYLEQLHDVRDAGATPVLMCSRHLAATARDADDYKRVYGELLSQADKPVLLHWLGEAFDPALAGYWGNHDAVLDIIDEHRERVAGIKLSLLDAEYEVEMRRRLPPGVRMFTGDDFNYPSLILGDDHGHSEALLGVLAVIAPPAAAALRALDEGDVTAYGEIMEPTLPLARHLFAAPTYHYKTGIVFLNWLAGHQDHLTMVNGAQSGRSPRHLLTLMRLADEAGLLPDAELAEHRAGAWLTTVGLNR
ncbi:MAG: dihydrodipicolinate synthase family protein [Actinomycetota bacterium]|nr:dihydrodipicolinate synthase family protein [Actinomycetota bacterium]